MEVNLVSDFMIHIKGFLSPDLCKTIIDTFQKDSKKRAGSTVTSQGEKKVEDVKISVEIDIKNEGLWKAVHEDLHKKVSQATIEIVSKSPALQVWPLQHTGFKIQHYKKNEGHFKWHFDALGSGAWSRQIAIIIYLNDVKEGGETCFLHQNLKVRPVEGDALFFPPFWTHLHNGEVPRSEDKYIITSFITFNIPALEKKKSA